MALRSSSGALGADPIELLSRQIAPAAKKKGVIKLPSNLVKDVKAELQTLRSNIDYISDSIIVTIVSALEENETCNRLDPTTFTLVLRIIIHAEYSRQKERGIILLTASLHQDTYKQPPLKTTKTRKVAIGKDCLLPLLLCFTDALEDAYIRRWIGILILQLLEFCDNNKMAFELTPEDVRRKLGTMVVKEQNEIVRITCGQLLKALINWEIPAQDLWPTGSDPALYTNFPRSSHTEKHWNNAFQLYVDELYHNSGPPEDFGTVYFAQILDVRPTGPQISNCIITVLVGRDLSICTPWNDASFTESFDIPLQLIVNAEIRKRSIEGISEQPVDIIFQLKSCQEIHCYRNAVEVNISEIRLTILDEDNANSLRQDVLMHGLGKELNQVEEISFIAEDLHDTIIPEEEMAVQHSSDDQPRPGPKKSQGEESFSLSKDLHDAVIPQKDMAIQHSSDGLPSFCLDPTTLQLEGNDHEEEDAEHSEISYRSPKDNQVEVTDIQFSSPFRKAFVESKCLAIEAAYEVGQDETDDNITYPSMPTDKLSLRLESRNITPIEEQNERDQDLNLDDPIVQGDLVIMTPVQSPILKLAVFDQSVHKDFEGKTEIATSPVALRYASPQRKPKSTLSRAKAKLKAEPKVSKSKTLNAGIKKVKKYGRKLKAEAPITNVAVAKPVPALKNTASRDAASKKEVKALVPRQNHAEPVAAKIRKNPPSKSLVPKKAREIETSKQAIGQSNGKALEMDRARQERRNSTAFPQEQVASNLDLHAPRKPMHNITSTQRRAARLTKALADISDIEQLEFSIGEPTEQDFTNKSLEIAIQRRNRSSPVNLISPGLVKTAAYSPEHIAFEATYVESENPADYSPYAALQLDSLPSSPDRISPVPLPEQVIKVTKWTLSDDVTIPSPILVRPSVPRRSPRLASKYSIKNSSVAMSRAGAKGSRPKELTITNGLSGDEETPYKDESGHDGSPLRGHESPLLYEYSARKTPLIAFDAKGPLNQGNRYSKILSSQRIARRKQIVDLKSRQVPIKTNIHITSGKRKLDMEHVSNEENNIRPQAPRVQRSVGRMPVARQELPIAFREIMDPIEPKIHLPARRNSKFGSQVSRVNENGSPRGNNNIVQEHASYKAAARKILKDTSLQVEDDNSNDDLLLHHDDDGGLKMFGSEHGFLLDCPAPSSNILKVQPLSLPPNREAARRHFPLPKVKIPEYRDVAVQVDDYQLNALADPFRKDSEMDLSSFARRLQYRRKTPVLQSMKNQMTRTSLDRQHALDEDLEATLVNIEDENPMQAKSSSSDSTGESSGENNDERARKRTLESQQDPCDQWRMALKPHQRGVFNALILVSKDLVRHLINHEEAIEDVLRAYEQGSTKLIRNLEKEHREKRQRAQHEMDQFKNTMITEYAKARLEISRIDETLRRQPTREMEQQWTQDYHDMEKVVEEGQKRCRS